MGAAAGAGKGVGASRVGEELPEVPGKVGSAAAAATTGIAAGVSQITSSVQAGKSAPKKLTRFFVVLYELHPFMDLFKCTNFTAAAISSSMPGLCAKAFAAKFQP
jgi:hypothetical protein